jgi:hypothetical protein
LRPPWPLPFPAKLTFIFKSLGWGPVHAHIGFANMVIQPPQITQKGPRNEDQRSENANAGHQKKI